MVTLKEEHESIVSENSVLRRVLGLRIDQPIEDYIIFEVLSVTINIRVFWDVTPCRLINRY